MVADVRATACLCLVVVACIWFEARIDIGHMNSEGDFVFFIFGKSGIFHRWAIMNRPYYAVTSKTLYLTVRKGASGKLRTTSVH